MDVSAIGAVLDHPDRALWVVTAAAGLRRGGLIATFVGSASIVPEMPRVVVGLAKHHFTWELVEASGAFGLHLLGEDQIDWVGRFGLETGRTRDKLSGLSVVEGSTGAPRLIDALGWLDCRVEATLDTGDRTMYLAEVVTGRLERDQSALTLQRTIPRMPADHLHALKTQLTRDIARDAEAIRTWRASRAKAD